MNRWVGTTEAAALLGVGPRTLYRLIDTGGLPAYRVGRVLRLRVEEIETYIESLRVHPGDLAHLNPARYEAPHRVVDLRAADTA